MNKELYEVINKLRMSMLSGQGITLTKKEIHLILKYITELEKEIAGDYEK